MSPDTPQQQAESQGSSGGRNLIVVFAGFLLLGAALGLLLLGGTIFRGDNDESQTGASSVLDQVSAFPTSEIGIAQIPSNRPAVGILEAGDQAYDFTLQDLDGNTVSLVDFRGRPVIVNFWATWCAPCRIEMPELQAAFEKYQDENLSILALDQDEPIDVARTYFYDEMNLTFTPLLDENSAIATSYGSYSVLPTSYFINGDGLVTAVHRGPMTMSQIEGYMADTIGGSQS